MALWTVWQFLSISYKKPFIFSKERWSLCIFDMYVHIHIYSHTHLFMCVRRKRSVKSQNEIWGVAPSLLIWPFLYTAVTSRPTGRWPVDRENGSLLYKSNGTQRKGGGGEPKKRLVQPLRSRRVKLKPLDGELEPHKPEKHPVSCHRGNLPKMKFASRLCLQLCLPRVILLLP